MTENLLIPSKCNFGAKHMQLFKCHFMKITSHIFINSNVRNKILDHSKILPVIRTLFFLVKMHLETVFEK